MTNNKLDLTELEGITFERLEQMEFWQNLIRPILVDSGYRIVNIEND